MLSPRTVALAALTLFVVVSGCQSNRTVAEVAPDDRFGHRFEEDGPDGRSTLSLSTPDSTTKYFYYPAVVDQLHIRHAPFDVSQPLDGQSVTVEVLIKGALPDGCTALHDVTQERIAQLISVTLRTRKPQGGLCTTVLRPYRFYLDLDGPFEEGAYTLRVNDHTKSFRITQPSAATDGR
ncbi:MAG: hypothetical protein AAGJ10_16440 [Bacteroidota bacterium]